MIIDQEIGDPLSIFYINNIQAVYNLTDRLGGKEAWRTVGQDCQKCKETSNLDVERRKTA